MSIIANFFPSIALFGDIDLLVALVLESSEVMSLCVTLNAVSLDFEYLCTTKDSIQAQQGLCPAARLPFPLLAFEICKAIELIAQALCVNRLVGCG